MTKAPDLYRTIGELTSPAERRAVVEARTAALALVALLGVNDSTCRTIQGAHDAVDQALTKVEELLFDPAWASDTTQDLDGSTSRPSN